MLLHLLRLLRLPLRLLRLLMMIGQMYAFETKSQATMAV